MKNLRNYILIVVAINFLSACNDDDNCISGSGDYVSRDYTVSNFEALSVGGIADIIITKDSTRSLRIEGQENILNVLAVNENNGTLIIGDDNCFKDLKTLKIYVSTPTLIGVNTSGTCDVTSNDVFNATIFDASISGTGSMNLNIGVQEFNSTISGDATIMVKGNATEQHYNISGIGKYNCFDLIGEQAYITISGDGNLEVNVSTYLKVDISGIGTVYYKGNPSIKQNISGVGQITNVN